MTIAIICEGATEKAFLPALRAFLRERLKDRMPRLDAVPFDGLINERELRRQLPRRLSGGGPADHVIVLADVYAGAGNRDTADGAKAQLRAWARTEDRVHVHVAMHEFEAWLLPYWHVIQQISGSAKKAPGINPESVNHDKPPSRHICEAFESRASARSYVKTRDAARILSKVDLRISVNACPELKALVNTILGLCGGELIE